MLSSFLEILFGAIVFGLIYWAIFDLFCLLAGLFLSRFDRTHALAVFLLNASLLCPRRLICSRCRFRSPGRHCRHVRCPYFDTSNYCCNFEN